MHRPPPTLRKHLQTPRQSLWVPVAIAAALLACGPPPTGAKLASDLPETIDEPYVLADDADLADRYDQLAVTSGREKSRLRGELSAEYARRIDYNLTHKRRYRAYAAFEGMLSMFDTSDLDGGTAASELGIHIERFKRIRDVFAKSGSANETAAALLALERVDNSNAAAYARELAEILAYADELAVLEYGAAGARSRPIAVLEHAVKVVPSAEGAERLLGYYQARQKHIDSVVRRAGANVDLIRAHGAGVLRAAWLMAALLIKTNQAERTIPVLSHVVGVGDDATLRRRLEKALAKGSTAKHWIEVSDAFELRDPEDSDAVAQMAVLRLGLAHHAGAELLHIAAAELALAEGGGPLAEHHFEQAMKANPQNRKTAEQLATLYASQLAKLALGQRILAATERLDKFEAFHDAIDGRFKPSVKPDLADAYAAMGRGLGSIGQLERAHDYLEKSLARRPTLEALDFLAQLEAKRGAHRQALALYERALAVPSTSAADDFHRNAILRRSGEAASALGHPSAAQRYWGRAVAGWDQINTTYELPAVLRASMHIELGKLAWSHRSSEQALELFELAIDTVPGDGGTHAEVVSFLLLKGKTTAAADTFHAALASDAIGDAIKIYMSLWLLADAARTHAPPDPLARELIKERDGGLWQDDLARFADGRISYARVRKRARTRRRQSELLFYAAMLRQGRQSPAVAKSLLDKVLRGNMILDYEYEMARQWSDDSRIPAP